MCWELRCMLLVCFTQEEQILMCWELRCMLFVCATSSLPTQLTVYSKFGFIRMVVTTCFEISYLQTDDVTPCILRKYPSQCILCSLCNLWNCSFASFQQLDNVAIATENARRYFQGIQGDADNKGELFGVKNMFRLRTGDSCLTMDILNVSAVHLNSGGEISCQS